MRSADHFFRGAACIGQLFGARGLARCAAHAYLEASLQKWPSLPAFAGLDAVCAARMRAKNLCGALRAPRMRRLARRLRRRTAAQARCTAGHIKFTEARQRRINLLINLSKFIKSKSE